MRGATQGDTEAGTQLTLNLWHPDCWALEATSEVPGGILSHAIYDAPQEGETVNGLFTAYGDSHDEVETLLDLLSESPLTGSVLELQERFDPHSRAMAPGNVVREFFLEYHPTDMISPTLREQGFIYSGPGRIEGGREYWDVYFTGDRSEIEPSLDAVREAEEADIKLERITSVVRGNASHESRFATLTASQRDAFELARKRGYYRWPRAVSTRELASELGVSKTTLLEHLRKAEAKLLDPQ